MSEENKEQNNEQQTTETTTYTQEQADQLVKEAQGKLRSSIGEQIKQAIEQDRAERAKQQEQEQLAEQSKFKELLESERNDWTSQKTELESKLKSLEMEKKDAVQNSTLAKLGVTDEITMLGLKTKYSTLEDAPDFSEWLPTQIKEAPRGRSTGSVGSVNQGSDSNQTIEQRLNSKDPKVAAQANREAFSGGMSSN